MEKSILQLLTRLARTLIGLVFSLSMTSLGMYLIVTEVLGMPVHQWTLPARLVGIAILAIYWGIAGHAAAEEYRRQQRALGRQVTGELDINGAGATAETAETITRMLNDRLRRQPARTAG